MRHAGFVLTGGHSSRMGQDKALLPYGSRKLVDHLAGQLLQAAGTVALIGAPERYGALGYAVYGDRAPADCHSRGGPLSGIYTALSLGRAEWNLIVACDLPNVSAGALRRILEAADQAGGTAGCVVPYAEPGGAQPLCAAYHARCLPALESALRNNRLKLMSLLEELEPVVLPGLSAELFVNMNTPADWGRIETWQKV